MLSTDELVGYVSRAELFPFIAEAESIHPTITTKNGICTVVLSTGEFNRTKVAKL